MSLRSCPQGLLDLLTAPTPLLPSTVVPRTARLAALTRALSRPRSPPPTTYIANLEILAHKKVERGTGVCADGADSAATVSQKPQAEVSTQLRVLLEQQLWELSPRVRQNWSASPHSGTEGPRRELWWGHLSVFYSLWQAQWALEPDLGLSLCCVMLGE